MESQGASTPLDIGDDSRFRSVDVIPAGGDSMWSAGWVIQATTGFVALGVALRIFRYLQNFPLYCDESMIAANFLDRGFLDLFRPLDYHQVGPLLWLAIELAAVKWLGFSEWTLRLFPFLCGLATVPLFRHVAGRFLKGVPLLMAVAIFAVSGWPLRYVAAVKPYASDLLVALAVLALAIEWYRRPLRTGWLWALVFAGPVAVALSLPSLFVLGGVGLVLLVPVWRTGNNKARAALLLYGTLTLATFVALMPFYRTAPQDHIQFQTAWAPAFPPLEKPARLPLWLLDIHTGYLFAYPEGDAHGASALTFIAFVIGAATLWKRRQTVIAWLLIAPFPLAMVAAAAHRYPYGLSARTSQYAAPMICMLAGLGIAVGLAWLPDPKIRRRMLVAVAAGLVLLGAGRLGYDLICPYKTYTDQRDRDFARWFWTELSRNSELVCAHEDLNADFDPEHWSGRATDMYLCYQRIYSARHRKGLAPNLSAISDAHPLRVVLFNETPQGTPAFDAWFRAMASRYRLRNLDVYPVSSLEKRPGANWDQLYLIYEFVPLPGVAQAGPLPSVPRQTGVVKR